MADKKVIHKRSNVINADGTPKLPTVEQLDYGEVAINYGDGREVISIKNANNEIVAFIPKRAFVEAPIVTEADYLLCVKDGEICLYKEKTVSYRLVGSDAGDSVMVIDDESITIPANKTIEGTCYDITEFTTNNLKEIYINGNFSAKLSSSNGSNDTVEKVDLTYRNGYEVDMEYMFYQYSALQSLSITGCAITSALHMCHGCERLADADFDGIDFSKCTSTWAMFNRCQVLKYVDVSDWDMSSVETMQAMFYECEDLEYVDVSKWNTSACTNMQGLFRFCYSLKEVDVSNFDTSNVTTMAYMFYYCSSLTSVDVSNFDTSNVTTMSYMFHNCSSLASLDVSNWDTGNVTTFNYMFWNCALLTELKVDGWNISSCIDLSHVFENCFLLEKLDLSGWDTGNVTTMSHLVNWCYALTELNLGNNWEMLNVTDVDGIFTLDELLTTITGTVKNLRISLDCSPCPLTRESALVLINGLSNEPAEENPTLRLSSTTMELLTEDDIQIATDKGWTIV